jgi:hypothetical protein
LIPRVIFIEHKARVKKPLTVTVRKKGVAREISPSN